LFVLLVAEQDKNEDQKAFAAMTDPVDGDVSMRANDCPFGAGPPPAF
jgi:hypothetical protein